jgi:5-methylcytosine-specific restriction endonuclease McrA
VSEQWKRPEAIARKEKTKQSLINRLHNDENYQKSRNTKREKFGIITPEQATEYRHYARSIRARAQKWAKKQGFTLGQQTFHVDHKFSILDAWHAGLSEEIVNHPANLQIIEATANSSKGSKSSITLTELLTLIADEFTSGTII